MAASDHLSPRQFNEYGFSKDRRCYSSDCHNPVSGWTPRSAIVAGAKGDDAVHTCSSCHKFYTGEERPKK
jgi:hypothetical protein